MAKDEKTAQDFQEIMAKVRRTAEKYVSAGGVRFNPDSARVNQVIRSLAMNKLKYGAAYCP